MSLTCLKNTRNCKYFISKCYNEFNKLFIKDTNNITEYRIMDKVFNRNMLRIYWKYHWLPEEYIFGFTIMNDLSSRQIQLDEMKLNLGPAKGKDFATVLGPSILTIDEISDKIIPTKNGNKYDIILQNHLL